MPTLLARWLILCPSLIVSSVSNFTAPSQEYGPNRQVSGTKGCLQFLQDGEDIAKLEETSRCSPVTGTFLVHELTSTMRNELVAGLMLLKLLIRKVIGARYYLNGYEAEESNKIPVSSDRTVRFKSARDSSGHGSHTASTAAGRFVNNMNYNTLGAGGARGGAPMARIAVYKCCWDSGCYDADLLAAFDDAIKDGVDIISVSLGPSSPQGDYFSDSISVGSFHATNHGILVVASAGNVGTPSSATNLAPWILTVGATSTDREFASFIVLGNKKKFMVRLNTFLAHGLESFLKNFL